MIPKIMAVVLLIYFLWLLRSVWLRLLDLKAWCAANLIVVGVPTVGVLMWLLNLRERQPEKARKVVGVIVIVIVGVIVIGVFFWLLHLVWLWLFKIFEDLKTWCAENLIISLIALGTVVGVSMWLLGIIACVLVSAFGVSM